MLRLIKRQNKLGDDFVCAETAGYLRNAELSAEPEFMLS